MPPNFLTTWPDLSTISRLHFSVSALVFAFRWNFVTDCWPMGENTDGTAKLSVLDTGDVEKGSVTFDNIDYADLDPGDVWSATGGG